MYQFNFGVAYPSKPLGSIFGIIFFSLFSQVSDQIYNDKIY